MQHDVVESRRTSDLAVLCTLHTQARMSTRTFPHMYIYIYIYICIHNTLILTVSTIILIIINTPKHALRTLS